ncbi:MAG: sigma-54-dependent Fis family transcriptional regulator [Chloroflexi bacterium]|nr:MAG: sigma-54-dependent Fis family transcriptional regulator [Chloroflexota bacterium]
MSITVLIVDDEDNARANISEYLTPLNYEVLGAATLAEARKFLQRGDGDVVVLDVSLPDGYGPSLLYETANMPTRPPIIIITAHGDIEMAVDAMKNGAHDFLSKPFKLDQLETSIQRAFETVRMRRELAHFREVQKNSLDFVQGQNPEFKRMLEFAQRAGQMQVSVLITGETGVGKDVLAQYIHASGPRANKPYIAINCAAIQSTVLESELFGYEAGAFTSAEKRKHGLMEVADGGVLFLDEISSMPLDMQAKLLRAIEESAFRRVGGTTLIKVDVQLLAASNRNLKDMIAAEEFRSDLYYRLKVVDMHLPPLRERKDDIPELVGFFLRRRNVAMGQNVENITPRAMEALMKYNWPGNIRELSHAIEHAILFSDGQTIDLPDLPSDIAHKNQSE